MALGACFAFLSLGSIALVVQIVDPRPAMEFLDIGLIARDISNDIIPWSSLGAVSSLNQKGNRFLELRIDREAASTIRFSWRHVISSLLGRFIGFPHYYITATALDHDADFLLRLIDHYRTADEDRRKAGVPPIASVTEGHG